MERMLVQLRLVRLFVGREWREAYAGTALGVLWNFLQPFATIVIYWWIFGVVWAVKLPQGVAAEGNVTFPFFLLVGMLPWLAFQEGVNKSAASVIARADVLRHGDFPVWVFPVAKVVLSHVIYLAVLGLMVLAVRHEHVLQHVVVYLSGGLILLLQLTFALGVGLLVSSLSVFLRDIPHVMGLLLMGLMFTAPILYPLAQVPEGVRGWVWLNPYTPYAVALKQIVLEGMIPSTQAWSGCLIMSSFFLISGVLVFRRLRPAFSDVV